MVPATIPSELIDRLTRAARVTVLTGAGVSAESGVQTFRDKDGLWQQLSPQELASIDGFLRNPKRVWEWYQHRRRILHAVEPNPGHFALTELQRLLPKLTIITQNVDRLHQRAGSAAVVELHGNLEENFCAQCRAPYPYDIDVNESELPCCEECGGLIRPAVVWFGEMLPAEAIEEAERASSTCDVFLSIGTSAEVYPAAALPLLAKREGAFLVEINPEPTSQTPAADCVLRGPSGYVLPLIVESLRARRN
jgi:NAD-dependent deacetylase